MIVLAKVALLGLGGLAALRATLMAVAVPDINLVLNFASLAVLVAGIYLAPKAIRAKAAEAQLSEKDRIIGTHKQLAEVREEQAQALRDKAAELGALLDESRSEAATWQARYQEQSQYTAGPALSAIMQLLEHGNREAERRHKELLLALRALRSLTRADGEPETETEFG